MALVNSHLQPTELRRVSTTVMGVQPTTTASHLHALKHHKPTLGLNQVGKDFKRGQKLSRERKVGQLYKKLLLPPNLRLN